MNRSPQPSIPPRRPNSIRATTWKTANQTCLDIHEASSVTEALKVFAEATHCLGYDVALASPKEASDSGENSRDSSSLSSEQCEEFRTKDEGVLFLEFKRREPLHRERAEILSVLIQHLHLAVSKLSFNPERAAVLFARLTRREREVFPHLTTGKSNQEIAAILGISTRTVEKHVSSILKKFDCDNRICLITKSGGFKGSP